MAFFKRELSPVERFETALKLKQTEREKLAVRLGLADKALAEQRATTEKLAVSGASNARLEKAEAKMRADEDRARMLRAEVADIDEQIVSAERALAEATAQRDRELLADQIEALAASIEPFPALAPAPRRWSTPSAGLRRRSPKPRSFPQASMRCAARCSRLRIWCAGNCGRSRCARVPAMRMQHWRYHPRQRRRLPPASSGR
jgi:hypothetical protein